MCSHGIEVGVMCGRCELEVMEDFVLHNLESLNPNEVALAIEEGVTTLNKVRLQMSIDYHWEDAA
jgi:hypothetical protein